MAKDAVKVVTLVENSQGVHKGLRAEHGISFYAEINGKKLLFDTGESNAFLENARKLKIDLSRLDALVLSHGHYDHTGGVRFLLKEGVKPPLWVGNGFFNEKYAKDSLTYEYIGSNFDAAFLREQGVFFKEIEEEVTEVLPGVYVVTRFKRFFEDEKVNPRFWVLKDGRFEQDTFMDEVLVVLETPKGWVVLLGCSHPGVKNMLATVKERLGKRIYAVVGGTHMVEATDQSMKVSLQYFSDGIADYVGVSHCTGEKATKAMEEGVKGSFPNHTGSMLWVD